MSSENSIIYRQIPREEIDTHLSTITYCVKKTYASKHGISLKNLERNESAVASINKIVSGAVKEVKSYEGLFFIAEDFKKKKIVGILCGNSFEKFDTCWKNYRNSARRLPKLFCQVIFNSYKSAKEKEALKLFALHALSKNSYEGIVFKVINSSNHVIIKENKTRTTQIDSNFVSDEVGYENLYLQTYDCDHSLLVKDVLDCGLEEIRELNDVEANAQLFRQLQDDSDISMHEYTVKQFTIIENLEKIISSSKHHIVEREAVKELSFIRKNVYELIFISVFKTAIITECMTKGDVNLTKKLIQFCNSFLNSRPIILNMMKIAIDLKNIECIRVIKEHLSLSDIQASLIYIQQKSLVDQKGFNEVINELQTYETSNSKHL